MNPIHGVVHWRRLLSVTALACTLAVTACTGNTAPPNPGPSTGAGTGTGTGSSGSTATKPAPVGSGPLTGDEHVWLDGITALHKAMDAAVPSELTPQTMRTLADRLSGCTRALHNLGAASSRLQPVADLAGQACAEYEKSGQCFATAAGIGPVVAGSSQERRYKEATDCAFAALSEGSKRFAAAEMQGFDLQDAANR